ncbi:MAG: amino acid ABC transporter substrate-binding protein [Chitinophagaceae bacterium]|nr:amino acid ABC transporter substrate-binding protein [Chitinophagaceae bacterium]
MKKGQGYLLTAALMIVFSSISFSQDTAHAKRYQIAIFTPLYLDSAFNENGVYKQGMNFPKYINSGLEFYEGAQLAIDSLQKEGLELDIHVFDSKSEKSPLTYVVNSTEFQNTDLVLGNVNANEAKMLANVVAKKGIPFINATYPNDAGVTNNPDFIILNSTLHTHCVAMYRFIQKNYPLAPIVLFRKKGAQEDKLKSYFEEISKTTAAVPLKIKYVLLDDNIDSAEVGDALGDASNTVCIAGSLDVNFGQQLTQALASIYPEHPSVIFAMPTWWDAAHFAKPVHKGMEVFYSTPFYMSPTQKLVMSIQSLFKTKFFSRPTDMVFRGYETLYHFAHLLVLNGGNLGSSLSDKRYKVFTDFDIQPVLDPKTNTLDYFENKKIYFVKKVDGNVVTVF